MALSQKRLEDLIVTNLESAGFKESGQYSRVREMAEAISKAVVEEITSNAKTVVGSGSSAGSWPVK